MIITQFWEGDIPLRPLNFSLEDEYGNNVTGFDVYSVKVRMLDSDNREVDLKGAQTIVLPNSPYITFTFPEDRTVFPKHGDYLLQLEIEVDGRRQSTNTHTIRVQKLGKRGRN